MLRCFSERSKKSDIYIFDRTFLRDNVKWHFAESKTNTDAIDTCQRCLLSASKRVSRFGRHLEDEDGQDGGNFETLNPLATCHRGMGSTLNSVQVDVGATPARKIKLPRKQRKHNDDTVTWIIHSCSASSTESFSRHLRAARFHSKIHRPALASTVESVPDAPTWIPRHCEKWVSSHPFMLMTFTST